MTARQAPSMAAIQAKIERRDAVLWAESERRDAARRDELERRVANVQADFDGTLYPTGVARQRRRESRRRSGGVRELLKPHGCCRSVADLLVPRAV